MAGEAGGSCQILAAESEALHASPASWSMDRGEGLHE